MSKEELIKQYNDKVKVKFLNLNLCSAANTENTLVVDCFYKKEFKDILLDEKDTNNKTVDIEPTKQLEDSIRDEIFKIKNKDIKILLLRIHSPYDSANEMYNNMNIRKNYIEEYMNHSIKVFLFDSIDSDFYSLI